MIVDIQESVNVFATELMKNGKVTKVEYDGNFTGEFYGKETIQRTNGKDTDLIRHSGDYILSGLSLDEASPFYETHRRLPNSPEELSDAIYTALIGIESRLTDPNSSTRLTADIEFSSDISLSSVPYAIHSDGTSRINRPLNKEEIVEVLSGLEKRLAPHYK